MSETDTKRDDRSEVYEYHVGIGNETHETRHAAVGQLAKYMRRDPVSPNPYYAGTFVDARAKHTNKQTDQEL